MATEIWVNIGSGNGLLPDGTKPLPKPMLTYHQWRPVTFILGWFNKRCLNHQSLKSIWKLHIKDLIQISQGPMRLNADHQCSYQSLRLQHFQNHIENTLIVNATGNKITPCGSPIFNTMELQFCANHSNIKLLSTGSSNHAQCFTHGHAVMLHWTTVLQWNSFVLHDDVIKWKHFLCY